MWAMAAEGARGAPTGRGAEPAAGSEGGVPGLLRGEAAVISCPSGAPLVAPGLCRSTLDLLRQQAPGGGGVTG